MTNIESISATDNDISKLWTLHLGPVSHGNELDIRLVKSK